MSESASTLTYGLIIGTVFGITLSFLLARLAGRVKGLAKLFGRDVQARRVAELEKENTTLTRRLEEKDDYIRRAMASLAEQNETEDPPA